MPSSFVKFNGVVCSNTLFSNTSVLTNSLSFRAMSTFKGSRTLRLVEHFWVPLLGASCSNKLLSALCGLPTSGLVSWICGPRCFCNRCSGGRRSLVLFSLSMYAKKTQNDDFLSGEPLEVLGKKRKGIPQQARTCLVRKQAQQPLSLPESAQTLAGIAFRTAGKSSKKYSAASKFARKPLPARNFGQTQPSQVFWMFNNKMFYALRGRPNSDQCCRERLDLP